MESLLICDGHNLLVRSIKAMQYKSDREMLKTSAGLITGPLVSFISMLSQQVKQVNPDYVQVCWDGGKSPFRVELDPEYKANRMAGNYGEESGPESQFTLCKEFLSLCNIPWIQRRDVEADDLVAGFVHDNPKVHRLIVSNDKDFFQLVGKNVTQLRIGLNELPWSVGSVVDKFGIDPSAIDLMMALTGDPGDNVNGVVGIGPKTAVKMLKTHDYDLDRVIELEPKITPYADRVRTNYKLVSLRHQDRVALGTHSLPKVPRFAPTTPESALWLSLATFCHTYELRVIQSRLESGALWKEWVPRP
jgi:DNA polymerase-1